MFQDMNSGQGNSRHRHGPELSDAFSDACQRMREHELAEMAAKAASAGFKAFPREVPLDNRTLTVEAQETYRTLLEASERLGYVLSRCQPPEMGGGAQGPACDIQMPENLHQAQIWIQERARDILNMAGMLMEAV